MKQLLISFAVFSAWAPIQYADAQQKPTQQQQETIEITNNDNTTTIEIKNGEVFIDGEKVNGYDAGKNLKIVRKFDKDNQVRMEKRSGAGRDGLKLNFDGGGDRAMRQEGQAMLGVQTEETSNGQGAKVSIVTQNSPADLSGIESGDVITKVDNVTITNPQDLANAIASYKPADKVDVTVQRKNGEKTIAVILSEKQMDMAENFNAMPGFEDFFKNFGNMGGDLDGPNGFGNFFSKSFGGSNMPRTAEGPKIGAEVEERADGEGLLITNVKPGSSAQKAGLKVGDVMTTVGGKKMSNVDDLSKTLYELKAKRDIVVNVKRGSKQETLYVEIPVELRKREF
jgi:serine protease Do